MEEYEVLLDRLAVPVSDSFWQLRTSERQLNPARCEAIEGVRCVEESGQVTLKVHKCTGPLEPTNVG
jgi:hypothetical protein